MKTNCPYCGQFYNLSEKFAGRKAKCKCGKVFRLPITESPDVTVSLVLKNFDTPEFKGIVESFKTLCEKKMNEPNMFIMPYDKDNLLTCTSIESVLSSLSKDFSVNIFEMSPTKCNLPNSAKYPSAFLFKCIAINSGKPETIRDVIKKVLWPVKNDRLKPPTLYTALSATESNNPKPFSLSDYGIFVPYKTLKFTNIRTHSFDHNPVFYRYRVALEKIKQLPIKLESFLQLLFTDCPNHLFQNSEFRASERSYDDFKVKIELKHSLKHELVDLAKKSESFNPFKSRHENLQKYFLLNDPFTIASEVPLWLESKEVKDYSDFFHTNNTLTGHIDILRYEKDGKIGVWDYKPGAAGEVSASIQVLLYALMLSIRTGINIKNFICGYFDETEAFLFDPAVMLLLAEKNT
jgi:hypothetical protein